MRGLMPLQGWEGATVAAISHARGRKCFSKVPVPRSMCVADCIVIS